MAKDRGEELFNAVRGGNKEQVLKLLGEGVDVNAKNEHGNTPLFSAATRGFEEITKLLIRNGADVGAWNESNGSTPLSSAVEAAAVGVARILIERGADVNTADNEWNTPLHIAANKGNQELVELLLDHNANLFLTNKQKALALQYAQKKKHEAIEELLQEIMGKQNALIEAVRKNEAQKVKELLDSGMSANTEDDRAPLLMKAVSRGFVKTTEVLIKHGADLDWQTGSGGTTPLASAAQKGFGDVVKLLIDAGANVFMTDNKDTTALTFAQKKGRKDIAELLQNAMDRQNELIEAVRDNAEQKVKDLLDSGMSANTKDDGPPLLMKAAFRGHEEVIKVLIEHGAKLDWQTPEGRTTPLASAAKKGFVNIVKLLVENGANVFMTDSKGRTALHWAQQEGNGEIAKLLNQKMCIALCDVASSGAIEKVKLCLESDVDVNSQDNKFGLAALHCSAKKGHHEVVKLLLERGAVVDLRDFSERTALYYAAGEEGDKEVVKLLLERGAKVDSQDLNKCTALHFAANAGCQDKVQLLLGAGADVNLQDKDECTALHFAANAGCQDKVQLLLDADAKVNSQDKDGYTALHFAATEGHQEVVKLLLERGADKTLLDNSGKSASDVAKNQSVKEMLDSYDEKNEENLDEGNPFETVFVDNVSPYGIAESGEDGVIDLDKNSEGDGLREEWFKAASEGNVTKVTQLLDRNVWRWVAEKDGQGRTALHHAAKAGHKEVVKLLLYKGASTKLLDNDESSALRDVLYSGNQEMFKLIVGQCGAALKSLWKEGDELPLCYAARNGYEDIVKLLLQHEKSVDSRTDHKTALCIAAENGHNEVVKSLLDSDANPFLTDKEHKTPLTRAKEKGHQEIAELLQKTMKSQEELFNAASEGDSTKVEQLLAGSMNLYIKDARGETLLFKAAQNGRKEMVELLIKKGMNVFLEDSDRKTALIHAQEKKYDQTMELLQKTMNLQTAFFDAVKERSKLQVESLLGQGVNINAQDKDGNTVLHNHGRWSGQLYVERLDKCGFVEFLIGKGADPDVKNNNGECVEGNGQLAYVLRPHKGKKYLSPWDIDSGSDNDDPYPTVDLSGADGAGEKILDLDEI